MSLRIDTSDLYASSVVIGNTGLGVLAENIPSSGDSGASFLYNDISLPVDVGKEIRGEILTFPSSGNLFAYEDGSFEFSGAADGRYDFTYKCFKDEVYVATYSVSLAVGTIDGSGAGPVAALVISSLSGTGAGTGGGSINGSGSGAIASLSLLGPNAIAYTGVMTLTAADVAAIVNAIYADPRLLTVVKFIALK